MIVKKKKEEIKSQRKSQNKLKNKSVQQTTDGKQQTKAWPISIEFATHFQCIVDKTMDFPDL